VFYKLDDEEEGFLSEAAFQLALERFRLGFTSKQREELLKIGEKTPAGDIKYNEFIDLVFDYDFSDEGMLNKSTLLNVSNISESLIATTLRSGLSSNTVIDG
jgi:hypothetical protein